jgi:cation-transporting P-type ATPase 13A2
LSTVFPEAFPILSASRPATVTSQQPSRTPSIVVANARAHIPLINGNIVPDPASGKGGAKDLMTIDLERGQTTWEETLGLLKIAEYRYTRFALQPGTGKWTMIRDWRDPRWTSVKAVGAGLAETVRAQRRILFGQNVIDIEGKSLLGLLVDEVLHPFYVFQIASIILWSVDDYYYYAFAIALISVSSIVSTLIETKRVSM